MGRLKPKWKAARRPRRAKRSGAATSLITVSEAETRSLGRRLGRLLRAGDFVGLIGSVGAGKTAFVRGVAKGAGVPFADVASPTFAIVYPYQGRDLRLNHVDLYRLSDPEELYATGYFDLIEGKQAALVEWLDRIPEAAVPDRLEIHFRDLGGDRRSLTLRARGLRARQLSDLWLGSNRTGRRRG